MEDRTLLELAAKAIGLHVAQGSKIAIDGRIWNPLEDDGDAFRLASKLDIQFYDGDYNPIVPYIKARIKMPWVGNHHRYIDEVIVTDKLSATRRAIVRAAAEIGKTMVDATPPAV